MTRPVVRRSVDDVWITADAIARVRRQLQRLGGEMAAKGVAVASIGDEEVVERPTGHLDVEVPVGGRHVFVCSLEPTEWAWMEGKAPRRGAYSFAIGIDPEPWPPVDRCPSAVWYAASTRGARWFDQWGRACNSPVPPECTCDGSEHEAGA